MRLSRFLHTAAGEPTTAEELQHALEAAVKKHFPKSMLKTVFRPHGIGHPNVTLYFTVAANKSELANGITENDLSYTILTIYGMDAEGKLSPKLEFHPTLGGDFMVKPEPGSHNVYGRVKVGLAKKTGTPAQIVQHVDKYFAKLHDSIKANKDKIPEDHLKLIEHNL